MTVHRYRVVVAGHLGKALLQAFEGLEIKHEGNNTALIGDLDQAALHGVLNRANSLGLDLIEAVRLPES